MLSKLLRLLCVHFFLSNQRSKHRSTSQWYHTLLCLVLARIECHATIMTYFVWVHVCLFFSTLLDNCIDYSTVHSDTSQSGMLPSDTSLISLWYPTLPSNARPPSVPHDRYCLSIIKSAPLNAHAKPLHIPPILASLGSPRYLMDFSAPTLFDFSLRNVLYLSHSCRVQNSHSFLIFKMFPCKCLNKPYSDHGLLK